MSFRDYCDGKCHGCKRQFYCMGSYCKDEDSCKDCRYKEGCHRDFDPKIKKEWLDFKTELKIGKFKNNTQI